MKISKTKGKAEEEEEFNDRQFIKIQKFEIENPQIRRIEYICKCFALCIIVLSASFHFYRLFRYESSGNTCPLLFDSGHWIGDTWQPDGCTMHEYTQVEIKTCLQNEKVALIGDSRMRNIYYHLANQVSQGPLSVGKDKHRNLIFKDSKNTSIEFYWIQELNDSVAKMLRLWLERNEVPHLILMGVGTWTIKNNKDIGIVDFQDALKSLSFIMNELSRNLTMYKYEALSTKRFHHEPQFIWMMQDPVVEEKLESGRKAITNNKIKLFNYAAQTSLTTAPFLRIMNATTLMAAGKPEETNDGLHYSSSIIKSKLDAVLNAFCNDYIYPDDASCCRDLEKITKLQFNAFAVFSTWYGRDPGKNSVVGIDCPSCTHPCYFATLTMNFKILVFLNKASVIMWFIMFVARKRKEKVTKGFVELDVNRYVAKSTLPWLYSDHMYEGMKAMAKLAGIVLYVFLADSSLLYDKEHKTYSNEAFFIPLVAIFIIALFTRAPTKQTTVLNPEQIEEWKGWMITVLMLYNYTQAEKILPVFVHMRLLISCFLFMVGFVYFREFWYSGDFGLYRVCKILAHLNVFCVLLCLVMGHPYQFYFIVPLITFWFFVVYMTLAFYPRVTNYIITENPKRVYAMVFKLLLLFILIFVIWANENICEWVFSLRGIKELFIDSNGRVQEWRFNSGLNRYSVLFGMFCCFVYVLLKKHNFVHDDVNTGCILHSTKLSLVTLLVAFIGLVGYEVQAFTCHSKSLCDQTHSIASCVPILAFVILRNVPGVLRTRYSVLFAWIGNISLELFIGQYHIWLANDGFGVHVLIPGYPTLNAFVTTFTFVCVIHEVKQCCAVLAESLVTKDVRIMFRRLIFFIIFLTVIWWHKTHEKKPTYY